MDFVATEDMDALAFGSSVLLRHFTFNVDSKMPITQFSLKKFQENFNVTHDQFIDFCILLGCDYCEKISGIGPKNAIKLIIEHKSIEKIIQNVDQKKIPVNWKFREARQLFKNPEVIPGEFFIHFLKGNFIVKVCLLGIPHFYFSEVSTLQTVSNHFKWFQKVDKK